MTAKDIINSIKDIEGLSFAQLADAIGVHPSQFYEIQNGKTKSISGSLAVKIFNSFPHYSLEFLLTGNTSSTTVDIPPFDQLYTMPTDCSAEPIIFGGDKLAARRWNEDYFLEDEWYLITLSTGDRLVRKISSNEGKLTLKTINRPNITIEKDDVMDLYIITSIIRTFYR